MKPFLIVIGTRPEAIKMAPICLEMRKRKIKFKILLTGQHKEMAESVLPYFNLKHHINLNVMKKNQSLSNLSSNLFTKLEQVISVKNFQGAFVQGDTTSSFVAGIVSFYNQLPVFHIEAGLRTNDIDTPFPEEFNRRTLSLIANHNFCPTKTSKKNLLNEGIPLQKVSVVGNTVVDSVNLIKNKIDNQKTTRTSNPSKKALYPKNFKKILLTIHRRENHGTKLIEVFKAVKRLLKNVPVHITFPVHPNPNVSKVAENYFKNTENITLTNPMNYFELIKVLDEVDLVLSDSGGLQEESPSFNKPILILRESTERPEILEAGGGILVGTNEDRVYNKTLELIQNHTLYKKMSNIKNPFGDGNSSKKIIDKVISQYEK